MRKIIFRTCPKCDGYGYIFKDGKRLLLKRQKCDKCKGKGIVYEET